MSKKQKITRQAYIDWDYVPLSNIKSQLDDLIEKYGEDARLEIVEEYGSYETRLSYTELETDEESEKRLRIEKMAKEGRRRHYEQLKKEFE